MKRDLFDAILQNKMFFITALLGFGLFYSFFYGMVTIPFLEIGFVKNTAPTVFDYLYIVAASALSALMVTLVKRPLKSVPGKVSILGMSTGVAAAVCPACLGVNVLFLGGITSIPLAFLVPYTVWIQFMGLLLLASGLWLALKSFNACPIKISGKSVRFDGNARIFLAILIVAVAILGYQILSMFTASAVKPTKVGNVTLDVASITSQVNPEQGFTIDATWGDSISKMVKSGVLDVNKLDDVLTNRYNQPLTTGQRALLTADYSNEKLTINSKNAVFMMYVLWALGKANNNTILHDSPFASSFVNYDIDVGNPGYGDVNLIGLTPEQQEIATYVAMNSYRPCCGNPTGTPDCSHGFSALGLVELMASEGYSKQQIFDAFVKFNSFWFPSNYVQDAIYFKLTQNKDWSNVDKELVAGQDYSSLSGSYAVKKQLQNLGV
ncbi:hypothetical protein EPN87_03935 [archaeon]|nr:MAG: hypothetical protein EPN87_03935 [archaeon]